MSLPSLNPDITSFPDSLWVLFPGLKSSWLVLCVQWNIRIGEWAPPVEPTLTSPLRVSLLAPLSESHHTRVYFPPGLPFLSYRETPWGRENPLHTPNVCQWQISRHTQEKSMIYCKVGRHIHRLLLGLLPFDQSWLTKFFRRVIAISSFLFILMLITTAEVNAQQVRSQVGNATFQSSVTTYRNTKGQAYTCCPVTHKNTGLKGQI